MNRLIPHFTMGALLTVGLMGCADAPYQPYSSNDPMQPVVRSQSPTIEGQVIRNDGDAYVLREQSGRETRVLLDRNTTRDNISVGDYVVARYDGPPSSAYATSVTRRGTNPGPTSLTALPRPLTLEGIVQRQDGNSYIIKDISGREVRVHADGATQRDGNITVGDKVKAVTSVMPSDAPYATNIYRLGNPNVIQGEVVRIDGNWYVVRDSTGRDVRIQANNATRFDRNIMVGDRVVAITNTMPSDAPYATNLYRLDNPNVIQGEVIRIEGNSYVVRDFSGRDVRLYSNSSTVWNNSIGIGDRIIAYTNQDSAIHLDSIAKR